MWNVFVYEKKNKKKLLSINLFLNRPADINYTTLQIINNNMK